MVIVDTDVLLLAFAFHNDIRQEVNTSFLNKVQNQQPAITIYNLMEILGQLSFNLSAEQLGAWQSWLVDAHQLTIIWPADLSEMMDRLSFQEEIYERPFAKMQAYRMAFLDALILDLAERTPDVNSFVTWNARHFEGKTHLRVITPKEFLNS